MRKKIDMPKQEDAAAVAARANGDMKVKGEVLDEMLKDCPGPAGPVRGCLARTRTA